MSRGTGIAVLAAVIGLIALVLIGLAYADSHPLPTPAPSVATPS